MVHLLKSCALTWWRGLHAMVILKAIPVETLVPGSFNCAAQFWTRIQTSHTTSSSGLGLGEGLMSHPLKQVSLLKTRALFKMAGEGYRALFITEREEARVGM